MPESRHCNMICNQTPQRWTQEEFFEIWIQFLSFVDEIHRIKSQGLKWVDFSSFSLWFPKPPIVIAYNNKFSLGQISCNMCRMVCVITQPIKDEDQPNWVISQLVPISVQFNELFSATELDEVFFRIYVGSLRVWSLVLLMLHCLFNPLFFLLWR